MIVGIVGYMSAGKSTAASYFSMKKWSVISMDALGHSLLNKKEVKEKIITNFGDDICDINGKISREMLADIVFTDKKRIKQLNKIIHPFLMKKALVQIRKEIKKGKSLVVEGALLEQLHLLRKVNYTILITAHPQVLYQRVKKYWKYSKIVFFDLLKSQKMPVAPDIVINNSGTKMELKNNVKKVVAFLESV